MSPRRRPLYFSVRPNEKTSWSVDSSKFGRELMEKMGWQKGKGLGKSESGMKEPISMARNAHTKGLGFATGETHNNFQVVQDCNDVLAKLNADMGLAPEEAAEEDQEPRSIVIRGKVITKEEYRSIFGLAKHRKKSSAPPVSVPPPEPEESTSDANHISSVNSVDYFRLKFAERLAKLKASKPPPPPPASEDEDVQEEIPEENSEEKEAAPSCEGTPSRSILSKTPKKFVYINGAVESSGKKIRFNKHISLLHLDLQEGTYQELVYPHKKKTKVMERFREFNKENSPTQVQSEDSSAEVQQEEVNPASPQLPLRQELPADDEPASQPRITTKKKKKRKLKDDSENQSSISKKLKFQTDSSEDA